MLCFRNGSDLVVDAGSISTLTALAPNTRYHITTFSTAQIDDIGLNSTYWSAFTWLNNNTLYVTRPRSTVGAQTPPWTEASSPSQGAVASRMGEIPPGAESSYNLGVNSDSTPNAVIEDDTSVGDPNYPPGGGVSYHDAIAGGFGSCFNGEFVGNPENKTGNHFSTGSTVEQSDFYALPTYGGQGTVYGTWLGYFELAQRYGDVCSISKHTGSHQFNRPVERYLDHYLHVGFVRHLHSPRDQ